MGPESNSSAFGSVPAGETAEYLERVRALAPELAAAGEHIERERRIPDALLSAMIDADLYRLLLPRSLGGAEVHPLTFMRVVEALASIEASPAWNVCQNAVCAMVGAYLPPHVARDVFGDKRAILAWGPPDGTARAVASDGGYRVSGSWSFASGMRHATWLGAYCPIHEADGTPRRTPEGNAVTRVMLIPAAKTTITDIWHVMGLRGTASDQFAVQDVFVPREYSVVRDEVTENRESGLLYRFTTRNMYASGFASIALGVARPMLEAFVRLATEKTPRGYKNRLRENNATQADVGLAEAKLRSARTYLAHTIADLCGQLEDVKKISIAQRMEIRLATTYAIHQAKEVCDFAYEAAGATAIFASNPFERRFRDLHTITQQMQGRKSHFQTVGQFLLGMEADTTFV